jgi:hypothetical protein
MDNYELAFRMQMQVPETLDLSKEDAKTKERNRPAVPSYAEWGLRGRLAW